MGVFKKIDLMVPGDEVTEPDSDQPDQQSSVKEFMKNLFHFFQQLVIATGVGDDALPGHGLEVAVPDLHRDATGEFVVFAQFKGNPFGHSNQFPVEEGRVDGVAFKSIFGADTFLFVIWDNGGFINAVRPSP